MTTSRARFGVRGGWQAPLAIAAGFAAAWWAVGAGSADAPYIDDWVYARSVEQLVQTGRLGVPSISAVYPVAQTLWAAPFAALLGFSFDALRLSTVAAAGLGAWALYLLLVELGCRRSTAGLGAAAMALHPVLFDLTFSFMTEVPFVAASTASLAACVRGVRADRASATWWGGAFALVAYLVRPVGLMLPLAALAVTAAAPGRAAALRRHGAPLAATVAAMLVLQIALPRVFGAHYWADARTENLQWWFTIPAVTYAKWTVEALVIATFPVAPLLLAAATSRRDLARLAGVALVLGVATVALVGEPVAPLPDGQTWSLQEFTARNMLTGGAPSQPWAPALDPWLAGAAAAAVAGLGVAATRAFDRDGGWGRGEAIVATYGVLQLAVVHAFWLYNDRYYVVFAPVLAVFGARALDRRPAARLAAAAMLGLVAVLDVTGVRDMLDVNRTASDAVRDLERSGVPPFDIDAGYTLNGWRFYVHPEHLPPGADVEHDVPGVTAGAGRHLGIVADPQPGETVVRAVPLHAVTWQVSRALYVVSRQAGADGTRTR
ncbi:MAG: glycosyltransferase family 39 protein [Vicinamibacterales bacterium]